MKTMMYIADMQATQRRSDIGERLAAFRKNAGLSQTALAKAVGLPQRTIANYETIANYIPSNVLVPLAEALGTTVDELLGLPPPKGPHRGPTSKLERLTTQVAQLPRAKQQFVMQMMETAVATAQQGS